VSSSARERRFADFLADSFAALEHEMPQAYAALCAAIAPREVLLAVDDETVGLAFAPTGVRFLRAPRTPRVEVRTGKTAILRVLDAEATLMDAVLDETLFLRGATDDLLAFHDGLLSYVHGAVRAPSFPSLLRAYRGATREER
jgi:hypothetical protein